MPELSTDNFLDLINGTFKDFDEPTFHQIATRLPRYEVMGRLLRKKKRVLSTGTGVNRSIMTDHSGSAHQTGLHGVYQYNVTNLMAQMYVPWRFTHSFFAYERREALMNPAPKRIYNEMKKKEADAMISLAEHMEAQFWGSPADSNDTLSVWGVFAWLIYSATSGIEGGNHPGFSTGVGGINSTTYSRWKNGAGQYSAITQGDAILKMRDLADDCNFESPVDVPDLRSGRGDQWRLYMGRDSKRAFENSGMQQNENLGRDVASMDGQIVFRKNPIVYIPKLNGRASAPIIGLNWDWFKIGFLKGDYLHRNKARMLDSQPNTAVVDYDSSWNCFPEDRRSHFLLAKSDPLND